jgi:hypothetical protein
MKFPALFVSAAIILFATLWAGSAFANKRIALVVGNNSYESVPRLQKAVNDAKAIEAKLKSLGFEVVLGLDLNRRQMVEKIQKFASDIKVGDQVLFFYAGHGVQIEDANMLLATDIPATGNIDREYVRFEGFNVEKILDMLHGRGAQTAILILDACRDNPFKKSGGSGTRAIGKERGLVPIEVARDGEFVMYSAGKGEPAFDSLGPDDDNLNSVFTRNLLTFMDDPKLELTTLAKRVQVTVRDTVEAKLPNKTQRPAYDDQLFGEFYFHPKDDEEDLFWNEIKNNTKAPAFKIYLQVYPNGKYKDEAKDKIKKLSSLQQPGAGDGLTPPIKHASFLPQHLTSFAGSVAHKSFDYLKGMTATQDQAGIAVIPVGLKNRKAVFPNSSRIRLKDSDVEDLTCLQLWLARNEILDRNGFCHMTPLGIQYFNNSNCRTTSTNILSNWTENQNVKLIQKWEALRRCTVK